MTGLAIAVILIYAVLAVLGGVGWFAARVADTHWPNRNRRNDGVFTFGSIVLAGWGALLLAYVYLHWR